MGLHSSVGREHCGANAEAMGSNPLEALKLQLLKLRLQLR